MAEKLTADMISKWEPAPAQKKHGQQVFASRVLREGMQFEKEGNHLQARLRYEKCKAYCQLRGIAYPPFSDKHSALIQEVGTKEVAPYVHGKLGPRAETVAKKQRKSWSGDKALAKRQGRESWLHRLIAQGKVAEAATFAVKHDLQISLEDVVKNAPLTTEPTTLASSAAVAPKRDMKQHGKCLAASKLCRAGRWDEAKVYCDANRLPWPPFPNIQLPVSGEGLSAISAAEVVAPPPEPLPALRPFQLDPDAREIAFMFPDTKAQWLRDHPDDPANISGKGRTPAAQAEVAGEAEAQAGASRTSPPLPEPPSDVSHSEPGEPVTGEPVPPHSTATSEPRKIGEILAANVFIDTLPDGNQRVRIVRKAKIWAKCPNPKMLSIRFLDGEKELSAVWLKNNNLRINEEISVVLERGLPGKSAIYEMVPKKL